MYERDLRPIPLGATVDTTAGFITRLPVAALSELTLAQDAEASTELIPDVAQEYDAERSHKDSPVSFSAVHLDFPGDFNQLRPSLVLLRKATDILCSLHHRQKTLMMFIPGMSFSVVHALDTVEKSVMPLEAEGECNPDSTAASRLLGSMPWAGLFFGSCQFILNCFDELEDRLVDREVELSNAIQASGIELTGTTDGGNDIRPGCGCEMLWKLVRKLHRPANIHTRALSAITSYRQKLNSCDVESRCSSAAIGLGGTSVSVLGRWDKNVAYLWGAKDLFDDTSARLACSVAAIARQHDHEISVATAALRVLSTLLADAEAAALSATKLVLHSEVLSAPLTSALLLPVATTIASVASIALIRVDAEDAVNGSADILCFVDWVLFTLRQCLDVSRYHEAGRSMVHLLWQHRVPAQLLELISGCGQIHECELAAVANESRVASWKRDGSTLLMHCCALQDFGGCCAGGEVLVPALSADVLCSLMAAHQCGLTLSRLLRSQAVVPRSLARFVDAAVAAASRAFEGPRCSRRGREALRALCRLAGGGHFAAPQATALALLGHGRVTGPQLWSIPVTSFARPPQYREMQAGSAGLGGNDDSDTDEDKDGDGPLSAAAGVPLSEAGDGGAWEAGWRVACSGGHVMWRSDSGSGGGTSDLQAGAAADVTARGRRWLFRRLVRDDGPALEGWLQGAVEALAAASAVVDEGKGAEGAGGNGGGGVCVDEWACAIAVVAALREPLFSEAVNGPWTWRARHLMQPLRAPSVLVSAPVPYSGRLAGPSLVGANQVGPKCLSLPLGLVGLALPASPADLASQLALARGAPLERAKSWLEALADPFSSALLVGYGSGGGSRAGGEGGWVGGGEPLSGLELRWTRCAEESEVNPAALALVAVDGKSPDALFGNGEW